MTSVSVLDKENRWFRKLLNELNFFFDETEEESVDFVISFKVEFDGYGFSLKWGDTVIVESHNESFHSYSHLRAEVYAQLIEYLKPIDCFSKAFYQRVEQLSSGGK